MNMMKVEYQMKAFKIEQVAEILACHPKTVRKMCNEGKLPFVALGPHCKRIPYEAVRDLLCGKSGVEKS